MRKGEFIMVKITENDLMEKAELREKMLNNVKVLDQVKELILLPNTELMNTSMVADYYEVGIEAIKSLYNRNKEELTQSGAKTLRGTELQELKTQLPDATLLGRANAVTVFTKRAILNVGMLLEKSTKAFEVRQALLNQQEVISDEQKTYGIDMKQQLQLAVINAKDEMELLIAMRELQNYNERHVAQLNAQIEELKPKGDYYDNLVDKNVLLNFRDTAKELKVKQKQFIDLLLNKKFVYRDKKDKLKPYNEYVPELFELKEFVKGNVGGSQTLITPKGREKFRLLIEKELIKN